MEKNFANLLLLHKVGFVFFLFFQICIWLSQLSSKNESFRCFAITKLFGNVNKFPKNKPS